MTKYESYAQRHRREEPRSASPTPLPKTSLPKDTFNQFVDDLDGKASKIQVAVLNERISDMENKLTNLTNIIKLVQKYTQTQDIQYEKEKKMMVGRESMLNTLISDQELTLRKQEEQLWSIEETHRKVNAQGLDQTVQSMIESLRREMNMKIQICMEELKNSPVVEQSRCTDHVLDQLVGRLDKVEHQARQVVTKNGYKREWAILKQEISSQMQRVVDKFTRLIQKPVNNRSVSPIKSATISSDKPTVRNLDRKLQSNESEQNVHPNKATDARSQSKEKPVAKKQLSRTSSPKAGAVEKRKQKQQELREIIKKSKDKRAVR